MRPEDLGRLPGEGLVAGEHVPDGLGQLAAMSTRATLAPRWGPRTFGAW